MESSNLTSVENRAASLGRQAVATLEHFGLGQLSDSFIVPAAKTSADLFYAEQVEVSYRGHQERLFVRIAKLPFNLVPAGRSTLPVANVFSLGPGLSGSGREWPLTLLLQATGKPDDIASLLQMVMNHFSFFEEPVYSQIPISASEATLHFAGCITNVVGYEAFTGG